MTCRLRTCTAAIVYLTWDLNIVHPQLFSGVLLCCVFYLDAMWSILVVLVAPADSSVKQSKPAKRHIAFPAGRFALS